MGDRRRELYDPYKEMHEFYSQTDPTEEQQFRFTEAMEYLIRNANCTDDKVAFSYDLAIYYRDIKNFQLEKKYLEIGLDADDDDVFKEQLGLIWYYGLGVEQDYERAFQYFSDCDESSRLAQYMLADMYHYGQYVEQDIPKYRDAVGKLFYSVMNEKNDVHFLTSTLFPEIALRFVQLEIEEGNADTFDVNVLYDARAVLTIRQENRPFWGNIKTMRRILETTVALCGPVDEPDLYDLLTLEADNAAVTFDYDGVPQRINIFPKSGETVYEFGDRWFHGAEDFLEKAKIAHKRITTVFEKITDVEIMINN